MIAMSLFGHRGKGLYVFATLMVGVLLSEALFRGDDDCTIALFFFVYILPSPPLSRSVACASHFG